MESKNGFEKIDGVVLSESELDIIIKTNYIKFYQNNGNGVDYVVIEDRDFLRAVLLFAKLKSRKYFEKKNNVLHRLHEGKQVYVKHDALDKLEKLYSQLEDVVKEILGIKFGRR